jgi:hypothetical protein
MDNIVSWLAPVIGIIIVVFLIAFLWEIGRRTWYWTAAKIFGWSEQEKFERETAWLDRSVARDEQQATKDKWAASNADRRRWRGKSNHVRDCLAGVSLERSLVEHSRDRGPGLRRHDYARRRRV